MTMIRTTILLISLFSAVMAQSGCMDTEACNYDETATEDCDGNIGGADDWCCDYIDYDDGVCDCDGNFFDCAGVCNGTDYSSCMLVTLSTLGLYENTDCSGDLQTTLSGECMGGDEYYNGPVFSEEDCGGIWLTEGCWLNDHACTESFDDSNGNEVWDEGEYWNDEDGNGEWSAGLTQEECESIPNSVYVSNDWGCAAICITYTLETEAATYDECLELEDFDNDIYYDWIYAGEWADSPEEEDGSNFYFYPSGTVWATCDMECTFDIELSEEECLEIGGEVHSHSECEFDTEPTQEECEGADGDTYWDDYDMDCYTWDASTCESLGGIFFEEFECWFQSEGSCTSAGGAWEGGLCNVGTWDECGVEFTEDEDFPPSLDLMIDSTTGNFIGVDLTWDFYGMMCLYFSWTAIEGDGLTLTDTCDELNVDTFIPSDFGINKAYPNPFNPSTEIEFGISEYSNVKIDVLDINGRVVDQIDSGFYTPGVYSLSFNAGNHSSGLYFIRLQSSGLTSMHKVMLMK